MKDYVVLDLETPNRYSNSMCSIGIVIVKDNVVEEEIYTLIDPEAEFDSFNIHFTGIGPEDVIGKPTFVDFWDEYEDLLTENIIVGQNITFDLSVISRALTRYDMPLPAFNYYCTLSSARRNLSLPDNSLSYIVHNVLNTTYNAHNAMADARMTNELFNYLDSFEDDKKSFIKTYCYRPNCSRDFNRNLDYNFNYLYGLLEKLKYNQYLSENHYKLIENWYITNKCYNNHQLLENILLKVSYILNNKNMNTRQLKLLTQSFKQIKRSPQYKAPILSLQVLQAILDTILCEKTISKNDEDFIRTWIENNNINDKEYKKFKKELKTAKNFEELIKNYKTILDMQINETLKN